MSHLSCSAGCLPWCTIYDGIHVINTVNEVVLQQVVNMFALLRAWPTAQRLRNDAT